MEKIDKAVVKAELDKLNTGLRDKSIDDIIQWIVNMHRIVDDYREPYKCFSCKSYPCGAYKAGCRDCSAWQ